METAKGDGIEVPARILPLAIFVLLSGTAVYFAGSTAAPALTEAWGLSDGQAASLTWSVQIGFIVGTLATAATGLADRFRSHRLIAVLLVLAAGANAALVWVPESLAVAVGLRFLAGLIAGPVYPIGMKLLATWYPRLGWELGLLLGAYTVGAGAAAVLQATGLPWQEAVIGASGLALFGAVLSVVALQPGPLLPAPQELEPRAGLDAFRVRGFRLAALGYFGHMWELFTLWALVPFWLEAAGLGSATVLAVTGGVFLAGGLGCVVAGYGSRRVGEARSALVALAASGALALASPLLFQAPPWLLIGAVLLWGAVVVADSPMFSAISARLAPREHVGTALTAQNSIGFALTVPSLLLVPAFVGWSGSWQYALLLLAPGPLLGLLPVLALLQGEEASEDTQAPAGPMP